MIWTGSAAIEGVGFKVGEEQVSRDRLAVLLNHVSRRSGEREPWRVMYPLAEVQVLLCC